MKETPITIPYSVAVAIMDRIFEVAYVANKAADPNSLEPVEAYSAAESVARQLFADMVEKLTPNGFIFMWDTSK